LTSTSGCSIAKPTARANDSAGIAQQFRRDHFINVSSVAGHKVTLAGVVQARSAGHHGRPAAGGEALKYPHDRYVAGRVICEAGVLRGRTRAGQPETGIDEPPLIRCLR
jgi:hypothetical protein